MASATRNPLVGLVLTIGESFAVSVAAGLVAAFIPFFEFRLFFLGFALFAAGVFAGRETVLGSLGFLGAYLGGFAGLYAALLIVWPENWTEVLALALALAAGLGGLLSGKLALLRVDRAVVRDQGVRRCVNCGVRVGPSAHKCWSCRATLTE
jgi:hypothetical protein